MEDFTLTPTKQKQLNKTLADLSIKSILFDMDIDIETLTIIPKNNHRQQPWLKNWKDKQRESDNDPASPEQAWA